MQNKLEVRHFIKLGVKEYQLSGTSKDLYRIAGIDAVAIEQACEELL